MQVWGIIWFQGQKCPPSEDETCFLHLPDCPNTHGKHRLCLSKEAFQWQYSLQWAQLAEIVLFSRIRPKQLEQCACATALDNNLSSPSRLLLECELSPIVFQTTPMANLTFLLVDIEYHSAFLTILSSVSPSLDGTLSHNTCTGWPLSRVTEVTHNPKPQWRLLQQKNNQLCQVNDDSNVFLKHLCD